MSSTRQRSSPASQQRDRRIGERVRVLRLERGLSMDQLGRLCAPKVTGSQINKVEKGLLKALTMDWVYRLADALGVHWLELTEPLAPDEKKLLNNYRGMSEEGGKAYIQVGEVMARSHPSNRDGEHERPSVRQRPFRKAT